MDAPRKRQWAGRPPDNALIAVSVREAREDDEAEFDALVLIFQGFTRLQDCRTRKAMRRQRYLPAGVPVITPELDRAA
jgi:hypothetical protein